MRGIPRGLNRLVLAIVNLLIVANIIVFCLFLTNFGSGVYFVAFLIVIPTSVLIYATIPAALKLKRSANGRGKAEGDPTVTRRFCFGDITLGNAIASTVGSVLVASSVFNATIGSLYYSASAPFLGWLILGALGGPLLVFLFLNSEEVRKFFSSTEQGSENATVVRYIVKHYGADTAWFITLIVFVALMALLFVEAGFVLMWAERLFGGGFDGIRVLAALWFVISLSYVLAGGYNQVLRTDVVQFVVLVSVTATVYWMILHIFGGRVGFLDEVSTIFSTFMSEPRFREHLSVQGITSTSAASTVSIMGGLGAGILMGAWLCAAPDVWNRLVHYMYVQPAKSGRAPVGWWQLAIIMLVIAVCLFVGDLLTGYIGILGFRNWDTFGLRDAPPMLAPFGAVEEVVRQLSSFQNGSNVVVPMVGPEIGSIFLALIMTAICTLCMTTIDTTVITLVQIRNDNVHRRTRSVSNLTSLRRWAVFVFSVPVGAVFLLFPLLGFQSFNRLVASIGTLLCGSIAVMFLYILIIRTWFPKLLAQEGRVLVFTLLCSFFATKVFTGMAMVNGWSFFGLDFSIGVGATLGIALILDGIVYLVALAGAGLFSRRRRALLTSRGEGLGASRQ